MTTVIAVALIATTPAYASAASGGACSPIDAMRAEDMASTANSWSKVYSAYKKFKHCDDGSIAEGFSDSISTLLALDGNMMSEFARLAAKDPGFQSFVVKHIDETVPVERLPAIEHMRESHCARSRDRFCKSLADAIERMTSVANLRR